MDAAIRLAREQLTADDHRTRMYAIAQLGLRDDTASAPLIAPLLNDMDHRVRIEALHALARFQYRAALPRIIERLHDEEGLVRAAAASALGVLRDPDAFEALVAYLDSDPSDVEYRAAITAVDQYDDPRRRALLIRALGKYSSHYFGCDICAKLATMPEPEVVDALIQATRTGGEDEVHAAAAEALGTIGDPRAIPALEYMAANDGGESWLPGRKGSRRNYVTAEEAIQSIHAKLGTLHELSVGRTDGKAPVWRHRMPDYTGCRKWFTEYRKDRDELVEDDTDPLIARVTLRFANAASDRLGTLTVEWYSHEGHYKVPEDPVPVLTIPWNAWGALPHCGDLLERLGRATGPAMQADAFCELLRLSGFEDRT